MRSQEHKKYKNPLALTEKGHEVAKQIAEKIDRILAEAGAGIREEEREIMYRSLFQISENLQKRCSLYEK